MERASGGRDPVFITLAAIVAVGVALRVYLLIVWHPALIGYPDSGYYIRDAGTHVFGDPIRVAGYVVFLRALRTVWPHLILVTVVQHLLGVTAGLLLYGAMRRDGAPRGLALVPAAVVILGGSELVLEHTILSDPLFIFLTILGLWCIVRSWQGGVWWALAAGLSLGAATTVREVELELLPFALACLCLVPAARLEARGELRSRGSLLARQIKLDGWLSRHPVLRGRAGAIVAGLVGAVVMIVPYLAAHDAATGAFGFTTAGNIQLYGRVAPWADCKKLGPPSGTAALCPQQPVSQREGSQYWEFSVASPLRREFGPTLPSDANSKLAAFSEAAIENQPLTYLKYTARTLVRVVDPSFSSSPYPAIGNAGAGYSPEGTLEQYFERSTSAAAQQVVDKYYRRSRLHAGDAGPIKTWERDTRLEGPLMALVVALALLAPFIAVRRLRSIGIVLVVFSIVLVVGPIIVHDYDYRYVIPAFGTLTAGAAIAVHGLWARAAARVRRRHYSERDPSGGTPALG